MDPISDYDEPPRLEREATESSPALWLDAMTGTMRIDGESYPENSMEFYRPVLDWMAAYLDRGAQSLRAELSLSYINTGSIKCLMDIFDTLEDAYRAGRRVDVLWYYDTANPRAREAAEEFREDVSFPFEIVARNPS